MAWLLDANAPFKHIVVTDGSYSLIGCGEQRTDKCEGSTVLRYGCRSELVLFFLPATMPL